MRSVNKVILIGNLTRDPELKTTTSGQSIVTFGLATNRQWKTSGGDQRSSAEFHECVAWAKLAEICSQYLKKGMLVYVEGYLKTRNWDREDGTRAYRTEIVLQDMIILEKRGGEGEDYFSEEAPSMVEEAPAAPAAPAAAPEVAAEPAAEATEEVAAPAPAAPAVEEAPAAESAPGELSADIADDNMF